MKIRNAVLTLGVLAGAALAGTSASAAGKVVELNYNSIFPAAHSNTVLATEWGKEVEKRTNGAVKINMFASATLAPADQTYDAVAKGIADVGMAVLSYTKGRFPLSEVLDLPLGYTSGHQATKVANAYYEKFQPKELADTKVMYLMAHGPGVVHTTKKQIEKMEDLKGVKIRCSGTSAKVVSHLGATPVAMPMNETYDALQKGVAEGVVAPMEALKGWKLGELVKYTAVNLGSSYSLGFFVTMNKQKWDSIPKDAQKIIEEINKEWIEKHAKNWDAIDVAGTEFATAKGVKITKLSPAEDARWAEAVKPVLAEYVAAMKAKGLPGEEALKFCQDMLKKAAK